MLRIVECIVVGHDLWLVGLAVVVCGLASHTAFSLFRRARPGSRRAHAWLMVAAAAMGTGIWATHFIAMLAYRTPWPIGYDLPLTAASALIAIAISAVGLLLAHQGRLLLGGGVAGSGIAALHYVAMHSLQGGFQLSWSAPYVIASLIIGIGMSALAFRLLSGATAMLNRFGVAATFTLAICGLHFTGMTAATLSFEPSILNGDVTGAEERQSMAIAVAAVAALLLAAGLLSAVFDGYMADRDAKEAERLRQYVSELESTQAELEATTADLSHALEAAAASSQAKTQFLTIMSHELRTPLNAIIGFADLMKMELHGPVGSPEYIDYAESIHRSGSHLLHLINDILDFSRIDAGKLAMADEMVDLKELLQECLRLVAPQAAEAEVRLESALTPDEVMVCGDRRRLLQIALNLMSNAIKFTPSGGKVQVECESPVDSVSFKIVDTGIGMSAEQIPVAMEVFGQIDSRLSRNFEGTGLGLPLCKNLVELHGGTLDIESAPSVGTTVTVTLPSRRQVANAAAA